MLLRACLILVVLACACREGDRLVSIDDALYFNFRRRNPASREVESYFERIDFTDPSAAVVGPAIRVPGQVFSVEGDTVYTVVRAYSDRTMPGEVSRLSVAGDVATLEARYHFGWNNVYTPVRVSGGGPILVTVNNWYAGSTAYYEDFVIVLDPQTIEDRQTFKSHASYRAIGAGRALATEYGDLMLLDMRDLTKPKVQAQFHRVDSYRFQVDQGVVFIAAGPYGIHHADIE